MMHAADYVIVGNSAAGIAAAESVRRAAPNASILMLSEEPYPAYGRPLISYLVEGKTTEDAIWLKETGFYEDHRIQTLFGPEFKAVRLDPEVHGLTLENGDMVTYGKCLLATGSVPFVPPIEGLDVAEDVFPFMTLDDALGAQQAAARLTQRAHEEQRRSKAVVIGAGLIGLKAAEALSLWVDEVLVLELAPRILPAVLDDEGATILQGLLASHGIACLPGVSARCVLPAQPNPCIALTNGEETPYDLLITAVGVRPNVKLAVDAGAQQGKGLLVDECFRTTLPDVFAAGDVVQTKDVLDGTLKPLALWPQAVRQGRLAGLQMAGAQDAEPESGSFAVNAVDFFDASLLTAGMINPPEDAGYEEVVLAQGNTYAKFVTKDDLLRGYILLNRPTNAGIYTAIIENTVPLSTLSAGIFTDAPHNLDFPAEQRWERLHRCYPEGLDARGWKEKA